MTPASGPDMTGAELTAPAATGRPPPSAMTRLALAGPVVTWTALACWTAAWFVILAPRGGIAWHFFTEGSRLMFSGRYGRFYHLPGGLHLYANYPWLQIGPLAFALAELIRHAGPDQGLVTAQVVMTGMGLATLAAIMHIALTFWAPTGHGAAVPADGAAARAGSTAVPRRDLTARRRVFLAGGAVFMIAWVELAVAFGHLDDALALLLAVLALAAAVRGRPLLTGLAVGLATDAKPWALVFLPVLLLAGGPASWPSPGRAGRPVRQNLHAWAVAAAGAGAAICAGWLPFFLADPGSTHAMHYAIRNLSDSGLRALGVTTRRTPTWDRSAQVAAGCMLGVLAIWRRRWPAVILLGVGARIALDPATHGYYTAGVLAGALIWDLLASRRPLPAWTVVAYCALSLVPLVTHDAAVRGWARLGLVVAFTVVILLGPARWNRVPGAGGGERAGKPGAAAS